MPPACVSVYVRASVSVCVRACVRACIYARVDICVRSHIWEGVRACYYDCGVRVCVCMCV